MPSEKEGIDSLKELKIWHFNQDVKFACQNIKT